MSDRLIAEGLKYLKEVFNRPYRVKEVESFIPEEIKYNAYTDDGRLIEVFIELVEADYSFLKGFGAFNPDIAKKYKWKPNQVVGKLDFSVEEDFAISGEGDAPRIFATVIEAVKQSMNRNRNLVGFMFTGFERSRARLYTTMVRRLSRQYDLEPVVLKNIKSDATGHPGMYAYVGNPRRAPWMFVDQVREDNLSNTIKEDYKVDYGGATPFNNAFRRYMSDFYPPGQDNKGSRITDVRNALLGHKLGLIGTEDINKLLQTYNQREREAVRQQDRDQYLNPEYQKKMRDIYSGNVSPSELGTVPGGEGTLANKAYNNALRRGTERDRMQALAKKIYRDFSNSKSPSKPGIQEDITAKASKQSIRPYVKNAVRGLRK